MGRAKLFYWAARRLIGSRTLLLFRLVPDSARKNPVPAVGGVLASVPIEVLVRLAENRGAPVSEYLQRLREGHSLLLACDANQQPLASGWLTLPRQRVSAIPWEWNTRVQVSPGEGFLWDFYTEPRARGQGLYRGILRRAIEYCADHGCHSLMIHCNEQNTGSRRGILAAGFHEKASLLMARFGPLYAINGPCGRQLSGRPGGISTVWMPRVPSCRDAMLAISASRACRTVTS